MGKKFGGLKKFCVGVVLPLLFLGNIPLEVYAASDGAQTYMKESYYEKFSSRFEQKNNIGLFEVAQTITQQNDGISISPSSVGRAKGDFLQFTAQVTKENSEIGDIIWSIEGANSSNTKIDEKGLLTIDPNETAQKIIVKAISDKDENTFAVSTVMVHASNDSFVKSVLILQDQLSIEKGESYLFKAVTITEGEISDKSVTWSLTGANSISTHVDEYGKVFIGKDETASSLVLVAKSNADGIIANSVNILVKEAGNNSILGMLVATAESYVSDGSVDKLTPSKKTAFIESLANAKAVLDSAEATSEEIKSAYTALMECIWELNYVSADKTELEALYNSVKDLDTTKYTDESVASFEEKLISAKDVLDNAELSVTDQKMIDKTVEELQEAFDALVEKTSPPSSSSSSSASSSSSSSSTSSSSSSSSSSTSSSGASSSNSSSSSNNESSKSNDDNGDSSKKANNSTAFKNKSKTNQKTGSQNSQQASGSSKSETISTSSSASSSSKNSSSSSSPEQTSKLDSSSQINITASEKTSTNFFFIVISILGILIIIGIIIWLKVRKNKK